ncbi:MAG: hypothetical protein DMG75_01425, partial [Acidobacteria bacterium]
MRKLLLSMFFGAAIVPQVLAASMQAKPIRSFQLMAWLAGGVSNNRLGRLVKERGIDFKTDELYSKALSAAGADTALIQVLRNASAKVGNGQKSDFPSALAKAAQLVRNKHYDEAEQKLRELLQSDSENAALHFALAYVLRQQEQWDGAFEEFTRSARLMPGFPETHSRLAYLFYRSDDSENAIAEARTALSMDPHNAEAYRYLGLGLFADGQYDAALHAFAESLEYEPDNPDTYYDMGITMRDKGNLHAAVAAYRHALRLNPQSWEAHTNLGIVLHDEGRNDEAIDEYREAKLLAPNEASVRNNLGNTFCDKGDYDNAIVEFRELFR